MPVKTLTEDRPAGFVISEANGRASREQVVIAANQVDLKSGTALGKLTAGGALVPYNPAGADGSQNLAGFLFERRKNDTAAQRAVTMARNCELNGRKLVYVNALNAGQLTALEAAAAALGILIRY